MQNVRSYVAIPINTQNANMHYIALLNRSVHCHSMNTAPLIQHHVAADRIHGLVASLTIINLSKFCPTYVYFHAQNMGHYSHS